jgi:hypothetical protein
MKLLRYVGVGRSGAVLGYPEPTSIADLWTHLVPDYQSRNYGPAIFRILWDRKVAKELGSISQRRYSSRLRNYLIPEELERVSAKLQKGEASIRFGNLKEGHGYNGERGDFCMVAGVIDRRHAVMYYRSLELIGGFAYDLALLAYLEETLRCNWKDITFITHKAFIFALKGNSNEKLYPKLRRILD